MPCRVLSYLVSTCLILSPPVSTCLLSSCPVLSSPVLSSPVLPYLALPCLVILTCPSCLVLPCRVLPCLVWSVLVRLVLSPLFFPLSFFVFLFYSNHLCSWLKTSESITCASTAWSFATCMASCVFKKFSCRAIHSVVSYLHTCICIHYCLALVLVSLYPIFLLLLLRSIYILYYYTCNILLHLRSVTRRNLWAKTLASVSRFLSSSGKRNCMFHSFVCSVK